MSNNSTPSTPGSNALKAMQDMSSTALCFKKPMPKKKIKQKVLCEDFYVQEIAKIIQRDFFPDLEKLNAQNQYLDAKERNDVIKLRELYAKYSGKTPMTNKNGSNASPATFETPLSQANRTPRPGQETDRKSEFQDTRPTSVADSHTLNSFLNKYTSEDNQSFDDIIDAADNKLKKKFAILFNEEDVSAERIAQAMELPSIEKQFDEDTKKQINTWTYKNKNYIMYIPDGVEFTKEEQMNFAKQKQTIEYSNTRLKENPFDESSNKARINELANKQARSLLNGKIGIDGNTVENKSTGNTSELFSYVKTPSPCPGQMCSPLMTWGEIEGTPFRLDGSDTPINTISGPSFRINETSRRENIAIELAEKAGERMRSQKLSAMETARKNIGSPYIRSSIDRRMAMSPAAKKLASLKLGRRTSMLTPEISLTPKTNKNVIRSTPSPIVKRKTNSLPLSNSNISQKPSFTSTDTYLTDDLLNIPSKRTKAADFF